MGIFDIFKRKKLIKVNYNSEDLTNDEKLAEAMNQIAYMRGVEARRKSEESQKKQSDSESEQEKEKIKSLMEQSKELRKKDINPLSLFKIFKYQMDKKHKNKIQFTTWNGEKVLGQVDDFYIMPDGGFGVGSDGKVIWASNNINNVFYFVAGLNTMAKNKIIPLCIDSENKFFPNLMTEETPSVVRTSDGKFKISKFNKKPFIEELADREDDISGLHNELINAEETIAEQQKEIYEKDREAKLHKNRANKIQSELSIALEQVAEIEKANGMIVRQNMALVSLKEINEDLIDSMEKVVKKWGDKIEEEIGDTQREKEWEDLKEKLTFAKENMPQTIYVQPEKEEKPTLSEKVRPARV